MAWREATVPWDLALVPSLQMKRTCQRIRSSEYQDIVFVFSYWLAVRLVHYHYRRRSLLERRHPGGRRDRVRRWSKGWAKKKPQRVVLDEPGGCRGWAEEPNELHEEVGQDLGMKTLAAEE